MDIAQVDPARLSLDLERFVRALRTRIADDPLSQSAAAVLSRLDTDGPCGVTELARAEKVSQPAMTQLVSRLKADGLVARRTAEEDRRTVRVSLTDAGLAALEHRRATRAEKVGAALRSLSDEERRSLLESLPALERLTAALHGGGDERPTDDV